MPRSLRVGSTDDFLSEERMAEQIQLRRVAGVPVGNVLHGVAYVNHGRWVVDCPFGCGSARMAYEGQGFWCVECGNAAAGGVEVPVDWPAANTVKAIESILVDRPLEKNRNWVPGETIAQLRKENADNGVGA